MDKHLRRHETKIIFYFFGLLLLGTWIIIVPSCVHYALSSECQLYVLLLLALSLPITLTWSSRLASEFFCRVVQPMTWIFPVGYWKAWWSGCGRNFPLPQGGGKSDQKQWTFLGNNPELGCICNRACSIGHHSAVRQQSFREGHCVL